MTPPPAPRDHVDVLIVGAGISGIGVARHLERRLPGTSYALLEARDALGGTWDLFRYPGIRSDSDLHTFGYASKPWTRDEAIADGDAILRYVQDAAAERGIDRHIRFGRRVRRAAWSSAEVRWTVEIELVHSGEITWMTAGWLLSASGYYRYDEPFSPDFPGRERFPGPVVHPQHWPQDLEYAGRRVVVIGSGATAVTLVPAMAGEAAHVTMLQRSPSYVLSLPSRDGFANRLRGLVGERRAYAITRRRNVRRQAAVYALSRRFPNAVRRVIRALAARQLPEGYDVDTHFNPSYDPWDQRLCLVPDGDLFAALREQRASIVTDVIETFTERGIRLVSGAELEADVIVAATGLNLLAFGGIELTVDGREVVLPDTLAYKGAMLSGVPNFAFVVGYTNASWTLKVDLVGRWVCRVLAHMRAGGFDTCVAEPPAMPVETRPLLSFSAGYVLRSLDAFPKQGTEPPWQLPMSYAEDVRRLRDGPIEDGTLRFAAAKRLAPA